MLRTANRLRASDMAVCKYIKTLDDLNNLVYDNLIGSNLVCLDRDASTKNGDILSKSLALCKGTFQRDLILGRSSCDSVFFRYNRTLYADKIKTSVQNLTIRLYQNGGITLSKIPFKYQKRFLFLGKPTAEFTCLSVIGYHNFIRLMVTDVDVFHRFIDFCYEKMIEGQHLFDDMFKDNERSPALLEKMHLLFCGGVIVKNGEHGRILQMVSVSDNPILGMSLKFNQLLDTRYRALADMTSGPNNPSIYDIGHDFQHPNPFSMIKRTKNNLRAIDCVIRSAALTLMGEDG